MNRQEYMELLARQIRCRRAIPLVKRELEAHIEEQKLHFMERGMPEQEAEQMAVREMGDPVEVGTQMDGIHRPKTNWRLIFFVGLISAVSLGAWYYLNVRMAQGESAGDMFRLFTKYLAYTAAGFGAMIGICYVDYTWFAVRAKKIMLVYCGVLAGILFFFTPGTGASSCIEDGWASALWLMAFLFMPLYCGVLYSYRGTGIIGITKGAAWMLPILISLIVCGGKLELLMFVLVLAAVLTYAVCMGIFRISVRRAVAGIWGAAAVLFAGIMMLENFGGYKGSVIPSEYSDFMSQSQNSVREAMLSSRAVGRAFGYTGAAAQASELASIFPAEKGFTLVYLAVCFGTFVSAVAVLILAALHFQLLSLAVRQKNRLGRLTGLGCGLVLAVHMFVYVLENTGLIIPEQMYCPFTVGSREVIVTYVLLGIMLSIYRYQSIAEA